MIAPPPIADNKNKNNNNNNNNNKNNKNNNNIVNNDTKSDTDSDDSSDWDDDDDFTSRKITINIKPISQINNQKISSSVDELRATVGTWKSLANINLVKPNSRRHHQSTLHLDNIQGLSSSGQSKQQQQQQQQQKSLSPQVSANPSMNSAFSNNISRLLPVAFAVQECLNSKLMPQASGDQVSEHLIGHIRMAVPPCLANPLASFDEQDLVFCLKSTNKSYNKIQLNEDFVERFKTPTNQEVDFPFDHQSKCESFRINMQAVREFARKKNRMDSGSKYFLLPELLRYYAKSGASSIPGSIVIENGFNIINDNNNSVQKLDQDLGNYNPIDVVSHWLCDLNVTKVRIDISLKNGLALTPGDIKNLKVSLEINGDVNSYHSKPDANWNPLDSRLTWSFASLNDFIQKSGNDNINSCLAKFNLNDGPSTPSSVNVQFSMNDKTLTGTQISLIDSDSSFCLARQKYEVKTSITEVR